MGANAKGCKKAGNNVLETHSVTTQGAVGTHYCRRACCLHEGGDTSAGLQQLGGSKIHDTLPHDDLPRDVEGKNVFDHRKSLMSSGCQEDSDVWRMLSEPGASLLRFSCEQGT